MISGKYRAEWMKYGLKLTKKKDATYDHYTPCQVDICVVGGEKAEVDHKLKIFRSATVKPLKRGHFGSNIKSTHSVSC